MSNSKKVVELLEEAITLLKKAEASAAPAEKSGSKKPASKKQEPAKEPRVLYWEDGDSTDLEEMNLRQLKKFAKDNDIELESTDEDEIRDEIFAAYQDDEDSEDEDSEDVEDDEDGDDEDEEDEEDNDVVTVITVINEDDEEEQIDLAEMKLPEIKKFAKEYEIALSAKALKDKDLAIEEIVEVFLAEAEGAEDDEDDEEDEDFDPRVAYGIDEMDDEELAEILVENGLSVKGKRQALEDRLIKAIEDGTVEIDEGE
ncbi:hypothetical protein D1872_178480 [compost metagenome]